jgi:hypothetical protein
LPLPATNNVNYPARVVKTFNVCYLPGSQKLMLYHPEGFLADVIANIYQIFPRREAGNVYFYDLVVS